MSPPPPIVLASTSPYRRALMERLGVAFESVDSGVDEDPYKDRGLSPQALAETLAMAKARAIAAIRPEAVVIGSDQVPSIDGMILNKPGTIEASIDQLARLNGREHELITAVAVIHGGREWTHCDVTRLVMRRLDPGAIERYARADRPIDCAGSYKLEARGITLFDRIDSEDHTAIIGLPLIALTTILRGIGIVIP